jgi:hypothetical protein
MSVSNLTHKTFIYDGLLRVSFVVVNKHLVDDLKAVGLWSKEMKDLMIQSKWLRAKYR